MAEKVMMRSNSIRNLIRLNMMTVGYIDLLMRLAGFLDFIEAQVMTFLISIILAAQVTPK